MKAPALEAGVSVLALEEFLKQTRRELPALVRWYWDLLAVKCGMANRAPTPPDEIRDEAGFLAAIRLNPNLPLHYIRAVRPDEVHPDAGHDASRSGPPSAGYVSAGEGEILTASEVLATFSDEPDWGMDQDLFPIEEYAYGQAPFGIATGKSSQAIFHMAFFHEPALLKALLRKLRPSLLEERVRVSRALAELAFQRNADYWGWRFGAWAIHYLQDLTQPYHARLFPPSKLRVLAGYLRGRPRRGLKYLVGATLRKHHVVFEAAVHYLLNEAVKKDLNSPFREALAGKGDSYEGTLELILKEISAGAARLARRTDRTLMRLISDPRIDDPDLDLIDLMGESIDEPLEAARRKRPRLFKRFENLVASSLTRTGRATRFVVKKLHA